MSIIAAVYGVTKFFRLGHARITTKMLSSEFIIISFVCTLFIVLKGVILGGIIVGNLPTQEQLSPLFEGWLWWLLFTMLPTSILVSISSFALPCYKMYKKFGSIRWNDVFRIIGHQPSIFLAPHLTPLMFTVKKVYVSDQIPATLNTNGVKIKRLCCYGSYELSERFTWANLIITMMFSVFLVCWKGYWITNGWKIFVSIVLGIILFGLFGFLQMYTNTESKHQNCPKHDKEECFECIQVYGFFNVIDKEFEACEDHEDIKRFLFKTSPEECKKCKIIDKR